MKLLLMLAYFGSLVGSLCASSPIATSYVIQSWNSESFLLMRPTVVNGKFVGIAACFEIQEDGGFKKRWEFEGEYSFEGRLFLGEEGNVLIRIAEVVQPPDDPDKIGLGQQTTLEFFRVGKLFKKLSLRDVVDPKKLEIATFAVPLSTHQIFKFDDAIMPKMGSISYFAYFNEGDRDAINGRSNPGAELFCAKTVQDEILVFKVSDGSLIYRKQLR